MSQIIKHSPGPFIASKGSEDDPERWIVLADNGTQPFVIATIENGQPGDTLDTEEATAHLFAAAPEMLEVLINLCYEVDYRCGGKIEGNSKLVELMRLARTAIAKAEWRVK